MTTRSAAHHSGTTAVVLGTRPEIVKLAPLVRRLGETAMVIHTGQHYDPEMSDVFIKDCALSAPDITLAIGGLSRGEQIGMAVQMLDQVFAARRPNAVVVHGDTNSALAGALAANARDIPLVHVEAGLRSRDRRMPEEHNRVLIDHLGDLLCAPTAGNVANLLGEGIPAQHIEQTGNTVVEALAQALPAPEARAKTLAAAGVRRNQFVLATIHRAENTDDPGVLRVILRELATLAQHGFEVFLPLHPRTRAAVRTAAGGALPRGIIDSPPLGYRNFLTLAAECALLVSDSGGIQEEATVLGRPVIVVRRSTERPEALTDFATLVPPGPEIGRVAESILGDVEAVHTRLAAIPSPFGDGLATARIHALLRERFPARRGAEGDPWDLSAELVSVHS